tara:strand:- start:109 stop:414 length:306 start_codon:yes stop_codon:yes gene_type:complete
MVNYKVVKAGATLRYPDGSMRGGAGYCVDLDGSHEAHACDGQLDKLEDPVDFASPDSTDSVRMVAPAPVIEVVEAVLAEPVAPAKKKKATKKKTSKKKSSK